MAVLVEAISFILRIDAIEKKYPGGWEAFVRNCPNNTLCADSNLARIGFMSPQDAKRFVSLLASDGLIYRKDDKAVDLVAVDQQQGFASQCKWAELGKVPIPGRESEYILACRAVGTDKEPLMTPDGWTYEGSLSEDFGYIEADSIPDRLDFLRSEDGLDVYRDKETGEEVYMVQISNDDSF